MIDDGMDMSIIEFDLDTKLVRISAANRPVLIAQKGVITEIKGDRKAIGGSTRKEDIPFTVHSIQLHEGDCIYMFSDGITDQFGGEDGKKLKRSGLIEILREVVNLPMTEQDEIVRTKFQDWKGDLPQIDDVILLGMRV
jgi:serine phosphatase RsbU (regulator of sigma subunit)